MSTTSTTRLLSPEEIAVQAGQQVPYVRLPEPGSVFAAREMRLRERAALHPMRDFLLFVAEIAHAQQALLQAHPEVPLPDADAIAEAARLGAPPLPAALWPRDPAWRTGLRSLLQALTPRLGDSPAQQTVARLAQADDDWLEQQAHKLLTGITLGLDLAAAPLIAAALQVYWTYLVLAAEAAHGASRLGTFGRTDDARACPCCGSAPVASITRIGANDGGYRYLQCALCATQWHMVRIKCAHCEGTKGIHYHALEARDAEPDGTARSAAVEAETCDVCHHYVKIVHMERDPNVEPVADDLASLTLDLLVAEAGFTRHGGNLMLLFGDAPLDADGER